MAIRFLDEEWAGISQRLLSLTREGKIKWTALPKFEPWDATIFTARLADGRSFNLRSKDSDDKFPFFLDFLDKSGETVTSFLTRPFQDHYIEDDEEAASQSIDALYALAERTVSGAAETVKSLLGELDKLAAPYGDDTPF